MRGISLPGGFGQPFGSVTVNGCLGRVVLEQVHPSPFALGAVGPGLLVQASSFVVARNCIVRGGCTTANARLVAEGGSFWGQNAAVSLWAATPALTVGNGGEVQLMWCNAFGGDGDCQAPCSGGPMPPFDNQPAIELQGGTVVARAARMVVGGDRIVQGAAVVGTGQLRLAPTVAVSGAITSLPPVQILAMPTVWSSSAAVGGAMTATAAGASGSVLFLVVGWPGPEHTVPGIQGPFWIETAGHFWAGVGTAMPLQASIAVPPLQALLGVEIAWQAVEYSPSAGFAASQPSIAFVY